MNSKSCHTGTIPPIKLNPVKLQCYYHYASKVAYCTSLLNAGHLTDALRSCVYNWLWWENGITFLNTFPFIAIAMCMWLLAAKLPIVTTKIHTPTLYCWKRVMGDVTYQSNGPQYKSANLYQHAVSQRQSRPWSHACGCTKNRCHSWSHTSLLWLHVVSWIYNDKHSVYI